MTAPLAPTAALLYIDAMSEQVRLNEPNGADWQDRSMRDLVAHLEHEHHQMLRGIVFHAAMLLNDLAATDEAPCATLLRCTFRQLSSDLILHIEKEEHTLFPLLGPLEDAWVRGEIPAAPRGEVRRATGELLVEHAAIARRMEQLHDESRAIGEDGSDACRRLLQNLAVLERRVQESLDLENRIVFPRAVALEDELERLSPALPATMTKGGAS